jgi:hypothetical protein
MPNMKTADTLTIECHAPERRRRTEIRMCHGSCCCCCCCLHTVGGIIGAGVAPSFGANNRMPLNYYYDEEDNISVRDIAKTRVSAVKVFWLLSLAATILGTLIGSTQGGSGFIVGLVIVLLVFPAIQLVCAIITLIWLSSTSRPDKPFQLWQVGKITLGLFLGTLGGIAAMGGIALIISLATRMP